MVAMLAVLSQFVYVGLFDGLYLQLSQLFSFFFLKLKIFLPHRFFLADCSFINFYLVDFLFTEKEALLPYIIAFY